MFDLTVPQSNFLPEGESINNIKDNKDNKHIEDIEDKKYMAYFAQMGSKMAMPVVASLSVGLSCERASQEASEAIEESQKAKGVMESPKPNSLEEEKKLLQAAGEWRGPQDIDYLKVSYYLRKTTDRHSLKILYAFKTRGKTDLLHNRYTIYFTDNRKDFRTNLKERWVDALDSDRPYAAIAESMQQANRMNQRVYGGKATPTRKGGGTARRLPLSPWITGCIFLDSEEDAYSLILRHHDFVAEFEIPVFIWEEAIDRWIKEWGPHQDSKKSYRTPPFYTQEWRRFS